ncbi:Spy0128 family protein [Caniella muris]|uniref:Spy0128 family protein n=1 Tax=Caniella muris TaxID=2941502 RepID=UPI00203F8F29|nr:FctA domain-containing protein [Caniella muris]
MSRRNPKAALAKRIAAVALSALMVLSTVPTSAVADALAAASADAASREAWEQVLDGRMGRLYTVAFDANGGVGEAMDPVEVGEPEVTVAEAEGQTGDGEAADHDPSLYRVVVPIPDLSREGFTFAGWSTTPDNEDVTETVTPEEGEPYERVVTRARIVEPGTELDRFSFAGDVDGDGRVADGETVDVFDAVDGDGTLTLYAQWAEVPVVAEDDDPADGSAGEAPDLDGPVEPGEETVSLDGDEELVAAPAATFSVREASDVPASAEGAFVDSVSAEWLDGAAQGGVLSLSCTDTTAVSARIRVRVALSGSVDHKAGTVTVRIPKQVVRGRDGALLGTLALAVPKAPSTSATFAYTEDGDSYVLANTRTLSAATQASFEFTVAGIDPLKVASGSVSDPFAPEVRVALPSGTVIGRDAGPLTLGVSTYAALDNAVAVADKLGVADSSFVPEGLKLEGDWVYASFKTYAHVTGSQPYDLSLSVRDTSGVAGARVLGEATRTVGTSQTVFGNAATQYVYVAYPRSAFSDGNTYHLSVGCDWRAEGADDGNVTSKSASAVKSYSPKAFENPQGAFNVFKEGAGEYTCDSDIVEDGKAKVAGLYPTALDELAAGRDVLVSWKVEQLGFDAAYTWEDLDGDGEQDDGEFGRRPVRYTIYDDAVVFDHDKALTGQDYEFCRIRVSRFTQRKWTQSDRTQNAYRNTGYHTAWGQVEPGDWCYLPCEADGLAGTMRFFATDGSGAEREVGTYTPATGTYTASNGAVADGDGIDLPSGAVAWRSELDTRADAQCWDIMATVRLKASSPKVSDAVAALFAGEDDPSTQIDNSARLTILPESRGRVVFDRTKTGRDYLEGLTVSVEAAQDVSATNDVDAQRASLSYKTTVTRASNVASRSNLWDNAYVHEASGTFWELLPPGVVPDVTSVRALNGDGRSAGTVGAVRAHEDWEGTGRTMLEVPVTWSTGIRALVTDGDRRVSGDRFRLAFEASMTWAAIADWGDAPVCHAMYVTDSDSLANASGRAGEVPGRTGAHTHSAEAASGAEGAFAAVGGSGPVAVYAKSAKPLGVDRAYATGLSKSVDVNGENRFSQGLSSPTAQGIVQDERNVWSGGDYTYRIHVENDEATRLSGIVLLDSLENYDPSGVDAGDTHWKGELSSIDLSQMRAAGIDPVVYYSGRDDLVFDEGYPLDLSDASVWSTERPAHVGAVAIDCTRAADGGPFTLDAGASVSAYLRMSAPLVSEVAADNGVSPDAVVDSTLADISDEGGSGGYHAYNNVAMAASKTSAQGVAEPSQIVHMDYTKVGLKERSVEVTKVWDDDSNRDGTRPGSVTVRLLRDGADTGRTALLSEDNGWHGRFGDLAGGTYTVAEDVPQGYVASYSKSVSGSVESWRVTNRHVPETVAVSGTKVWDDGHDAAGRRPAYVTVGVWGTPEGGPERLYRTVRVYAPEAPEGEGAGDEWPFTVAGLKAFDGGRRVTYRLGETGAETAYSSEAFHEASQSVDGTWTIVNTYMPYGRLDVVKRVVGYSPEGARHPFQVRFWDRDGAPVTEAVALEVAGDETSYVPGQVFEIPSGQTASFPQVGEGWTYEVRELPAPGWSLVRSSGANGTVKAGATVEAAFENRYTATGTASFEAEKELVGRDVAAGQFSFTSQRVEAGQATGPIATVKTSEGGKVPFSFALSMTDVGRRVTWELKEVKGSLSYITYDTSVYRVSATVVDDGAGRLSATDWEVSRLDGGAFAPVGECRFVNGYSAQGSYGMPVAKTWPGWGGVFKGLGATKDPTGHGFADALPVDQWWYSSGTTPFLIAAYDGEGNQVATTRPDSVTGTCTLGIRANIYSRLSADGSWEPVYTLGDQTVGEEEFFEPHTYTVKEVVDDSVFTRDWATRWVDADKAEAFAQAVRDAMVWDTHEEEVTLRFTDNGKGAIVAEIVDGPGRAAFENGFQEGSVTVEKQMEPDGDANREFTFHVQVEGGPDEVEVAWPEEPKGVTFDGNGGTVGGTDSQTLPYVPGGSYETGEVAGPLGYEFLWWGDSDGNKVDLGAVPDGGTVYATWLDCSKSGRVKKESGTCWWGIGSDGTLMVVPKDGSRGELENPESYARSPWHAFRINIMRVASIGDIVLPSDASRLFYDCKNLRELSGLSSWDATQVKRADSMFSGCTNLESLDGLGGLDFRGVETLAEIFFECKNLTDISALSSWTLESATNCGPMFFGCSSLKSLSGIGNLRLPEGANISLMFCGTSSLADISAIGDWDWSRRYTNSGNLFDGDGALFLTCLRIPTFPATLSDDEVALRWDNYRGALGSLDGSVLSATWRKGSTTATLESILATEDVGTLRGGTLSGTWNRVGTSLASDLSPVRAASPDGTSEAAPLGLGAQAAAAPAAPEAVASAGDGTVVASGTVGYTDVPWTLSDDGVLTLHGGAGATLEVIGGGAVDGGWKDADGNYAVDFKQKVVSVRVDGELSATSLRNGFQGFSALSDISGLSSLDLSGCTDLSGVFGSCSSLSDISGLSSLDVSACTDLSGVFQGCSSLSDITPLASWRPGRAAGGAVSLEYTFNGTAIEDLDALEGWFDVREAGSEAPVVDLSGTFGHCRSLTDASALRFWYVSRSPYDRGRTFTDTPALTRVGTGFVSAAGSHDPAFSGWSDSTMVGRSLYESNDKVASAGSLWRTRYGDGDRAFSGGTGEAMSWTNTTDGIWELVDSNKTVSFDLNGGTGTAPDPVEFEWEGESGGTVEIPDGSALTGPAGKTFAGWCRDPEGSGPIVVRDEYNTSCNASDLMDASEDSVTLYAVWRNAPVTVEFLGADGSVAASFEVDPEAGVAETPWVEPPAGKRLVAWAPTAAPDSHVLPGRGTGAVDASWAQGGKVSFAPVFEDLAGTVEGSDGTYTIHLRPGEKATLKGLPAGAAYRVWEETAAGWVLVSSSGDMGTVLPGADSTATFVNAYRPTEVRAEVHAQKEVVGAGTASPYGYVFELVDDSGEVVSKGVSGTDGSVRILTPALNLPGTYTYRVREAAEQPHASIGALKMSMDDTERTVVVTVADDGQGRLVADVAYDGAGMTFTNVVEPGTVTVTKQVTVFDRFGTFAGPGAGSFDFVATFEDGRTEEFRLAHGESRVLSVPHGQTVRVEEVDVPAGHTLYVRVNGLDVGGDGVSAIVEGVSGSDIPVSFTNAYHASGTVTLSARKSVPSMGEVPPFIFRARYDSYRCPEGASWGDWAEIRVGGQGFGPGRNVFSSVESLGDGLVEFDEVLFTMPGTYTFDLYEVVGDSDAYTYDGHHVTATATVTDNGDGTLSASVSYDGSPVPPTFTNTVATKRLRVSKELAGTAHDASGETFSMRLSVGPVDEAALASLHLTQAQAEVALTVDGEPYVSGEAFAVSAGQTVTVEGPAAIIDAVTAVTEDEAPGYTASYSETVEEGVRTLVVTNSYGAAGTFHARARKTFDGEAPGDRRFTFELRDGDGNLLARASNDGAGDVAFDGVEVTEPGTYRYSITEVDDGQDGVDYDGREVEVSVVATDAGAGELSCEVSYDGSPDPPVFENRTRAALAMPAAGGTGLPAALVAAGAAMCVAARIRSWRRRDGR